MNILLDTNIYYQDFSLKSPRFEALFEYLEKTKCKILIPRIVYEEIFDNYKRELKKNFKNAKRIEYFTGGGIKIIKNEDEILREFRERIDKLISTKKALVLEHNDTDINILIKKSIELSKPFKRDGKGFKDALIWESITKYLNTNKSKHLCFVTANTVDFGEGNLDSTLITELAGSKERLSYFNRLEDFLSEYYIEKVDYINKKFVEDFIVQHKEMLTETIDLSDLDPDEIDFSYSSYYLSVIINTELLDKELDSISLQNFYIYNADSKFYYLEAELELGLIIDAELTAYNPDTSEIDNLDESGYVTLNITELIKVDRKTKEIYFE